MPVGEGRKFWVEVDSRESRSKTFEVLRKLEEVDIQVRRLGLGDYSWQGGLLFERKTLIDFCQSIQDGRLLRQACTLAASPAQAVLILEGSVCDLAATRMSRAGIQGALICVSVLLGIPVLRAKTPEECARLMLYAARQVHRRGGRAAARKVKLRRPRGKRKLQLEILQGLPGIGPRRACLLLEEFGSVRGVMTADSEELSHVPGLGPKTAKAILWSVRETAESYSRKPTS